MTRGILKIISDTTKFWPIKDDPTLLREGRLQRLLLKLKKNDHLDNGVYENIYPKGSQPAKIYGLPNECIRIVNPNIYVAISPHLSIIYWNIQLQPGQIPM